MNPLFSPSAYQRPAGVDEAGRGPLAGPVVAAAVLLPEGKTPPWPLADSKTIPHERRVALFDWLYESGAEIGVGIVDHEEIDKMNILRASLHAMKKAVLELKNPPDFLMIDGTFTLDMPLRQEAIVKGDSKVAAISAASIVAKVTRDRMMDEFHKQFPQYGFDRHKGYPTKEHKQAIIKHGPSPIHRRTFRGVKETC
ncbi:MAG: ribonuclease HII [Nitrospinae bacterium]|nr:ribonuclease HII [Nitrospinota bacterium]